MDGAEPRRPEPVGAAPVSLPGTLHGQLFLLAHDRRRIRFDAGDRPRYGLALRTAMFSDLYLAGHLSDRDGEPIAIDGPGPDDPVLHGILDEVAESNYQDWSDAILHDSHSRTPEVVHAQLGAEWQRTELRRRLGIVPYNRVRLTNSQLVQQLAGRVTTALHTALAGRPADARLLSVGLIGALGQLPTVFSFAEAIRHEHALHELVFEGIPPIFGMLTVVERARGQFKSEWDNSQLRGGG